MLPERYGAKRAAWVDYWAPIDGKTVGIAIFDHPENPRHPTWWHARYYGLVAANPFGIHDFEKKPEGTGDMKILILKQIESGPALAIHQDNRFGTVPFTLPECEK